MTDGFLFFASAPPTRTHTAPEGLSGECLKQCFTRDMGGAVQAAVALRAGEYFRIKAFTEFETFGLKDATYVHSVSLGLATSFCW